MRYTTTRRFGKGRFRNDRYGNGSHFQHSINISVALKVPTRRRKPKFSLDHVHKKSNYDIINITDKVIKYSLFYMGHQMNIVIYMNAMNIIPRNLIRQ